MWNSVLTDNFTRSNGAVGNGWIEATSTWSINNNRLVSTGTSNILYRSDNKLNLLQELTINNLEGINILVSRYNVSTGDAYYALILKTGTNTYDLVIGKYSNNLNSVTNLSTVSFTTTETTVILKLVTQSIYPTNLIAVVTNTSNTVISSLGATDSTVILQQSNKYGIRYATLAATNANISNIVISDEVLNKVDINSTKLLTSPYNWLKTTNLLTNNCGSYLRLKFTGTSIKLRIDNSKHVNVNNLSSYYPKIKWITDNKEWKTLQINNSIIELETGLTNTTHEIIIYVSQLHYADIDRWITPVSSLTITDIYIDDNAEFLDVTKKTGNILIYGDSITEGIYLGSTSVSDATQSYSYYLGTNYNKEYGVVAFSGQGISKAVNNETILNVNVPKLATSWDKYYNNTSRLINGKFNPIPELIFINIGTNDLNETDTVVSTNYKELVLNIRNASTRDTVIYVIIPFGKFKLTSITTTINELKKTDPNLHLISVDDFLSNNLNFTGTANIYSHDTIHPNTYASPILASNLVSKSSKIDEKYKLKNYLLKESINLKFDRLIDTKYINRYLN